MKKLNKYEAKMDKIINKIAVGDYSYSSPAEMLQMLSVSAIGIYNELKEWIIKALENPEGELKNIRDFADIDFSNIRYLIHSLLAVVPIQVNRRLVGLAKGVDFVYSAIDIFNKYSDVDDRRIKLTTLLRENQTLIEELLESFITLEEIEEWLKNTAKIAKKEG